MLIGVSVSRCLNDIFNDRVLEDDVVVIIGRTRAEDLDAFIGLIKYHHRAGDFISFKNDGWGTPDLEKCIEIGTHMWKRGKIHQPRNFSELNAIRSFPGRPWFSLMPMPGEMNDLTRDAYNTFLVAAKLCGDEIDENPADPRH